LNTYREAGTERAKYWIRTVEGPVTDYLLIPRGKGNGEKRFKVAAEPFCYQDGVASAGYHQTRMQGGVIKGGLHVRNRLLGGQDSRWLKQQRGPAGVSRWEGRGHRGGTRMDDFVAIARAG
jgi:hypothetical protein